MKMERWRRLFALCALLGGTFALSPAFAAAPDRAEDKPKGVVMRGDERCTECHDEVDGPQLLAIGKTRHGTVADLRTPTCVSCHGDSDLHVKEAGRGEGPTPPVDVGFTKKNPADVQARNGACLSCHQGGNRINWQSSAHATQEVACTSCHSVHTQHDKVKSAQSQTETCVSCHKTQRSEINKQSHHPLVEGKMSCSSCHNPHGSSGPKMLVKNTLNETCYSCHAEKRGPFLWEHPPAADNCANCHSPHGSNHTPLLNSRGPYLCQQCHDFTNHPSTTYSGTGLPVSAGGTAPAQQLLLRNCANCHTQVHGTNHPSGARYTR